MRILTNIVSKRAHDVLFWLFLAWMITEVGNTYYERQHGFVWTKSITYTESNRQLKNPNCGFYTMYGFHIKDEQEDFVKQLEQKMYDDEWVLSLIQINLNNYKDRPITEVGLMNIQALFQALEGREKQYIIRFLYDWDGKALETEPEDIQVILGHMSQLEEIFAEYSHIIFTFQGVFLGDCGEMHHSVHMTEEGMTALLKQFFLISPEDTYLSVRTPQHWRVLTGIGEAEEFGSTELSKRLGLYNDGMLGTDLDTGTYGTVTKEEAGVTGKWTREEELEFQSELCKLVPNGGEVIIENPLNDFESAIENLARMHVSYLNQAYDPNVINKWKNSIVTEEGCFYGMDGFSYMERHLGYRLLIDEVDLEYDFWEDGLHIKIAMKNIGFAPLYKEPEAVLVIRQKDTGEEWRYLVEANLRTMAGGEDAEQVHYVKETIALEEFAVGTYEVFFSIKDTDSGWNIELANEQEIQEMGYKLGTFYIDEIKHPLLEDAKEYEKSIQDLLNKLEER